MLEILIEGKIKNIVMIAEGRRCETREYIENLDKKTRTKLRAIMEIMAKRGEIKNIELFRPLGKGIYEFKAHLARVFCFFYQNLVVCTHGANKPKKRRLKIEIDKAIAIKQNFLREIKERS